MGRPEEGRLERAIAEQSRRLRRARGLTVTGLAARVGISKAMLSKVENAQISCSLTTLGRLADALDVPVAAFFRPPGDGDEPARDGPCRMAARVVTLVDGDEGPLEQPSAVGLVYVLDGVMVYGHGSRRHTLRPGDALELGDGAPHGPLELLEPPVRFLAVLAHGS